MVNNIENTLNCVSQCFDRKYNFKCEYAWTLNLKVAEYVFLDAAYYDNFEHMLSSWEDTLEGEIIKNEDYTDSYKDDELQNLDSFFYKIRNSGVYTWSYEEIVCSAVFIIFHNKLSLTGQIDFTSWSCLINIIMLVDGKVRDEIINFIEKNGYFYLEPKVVINAAKDYFSFYEKTTFFFETESEEREKKQKEKLVCVLKLLGIEKPEIQFLFSKAFENKSFDPIMDFLNNYSYEKPEVLTLADLKFYLNQINWSSGQKSRIMEDVLSSLESMDPADLLSSWDSFTISSNLSVFSLYEEIPSTRKLKILNDQIFNIVAHLICLIKTTSENNRSLIFYPPLRIVRQRLSSIAPNDLNSLYNLIILQDDFIGTSSKNQVLGVARGIVLCILFGTVIISSLANSQSAFAGQAASSI